MYMRCIFQSGYLRNSGKLASDISSTFHKRQFVDCKVRACYKSFSHPRGIRGKGIERILIPSVIYETVPGSTRRMPVRGFDCRTTAIRRGTLTLYSNLA